MEWTQTKSYDDKPLPFFELLDETNKQVGAVELQYNHWYGSYHPKTGEFADGMVFIDELFFTKELAMKAVENAIANEGNSENG